MYICTYVLYIYTIVCIYVYTYIDIDTHHIFIISSIGYLHCFHTLATVNSAEHRSAPYLFELVFSSFTDTC